MKANRALLFLLHNTSSVLFVLLFCVFGIIAPRFFTVSNMTNILINASYIGIVAVGMTFVLLTGGIDISVGSTMYLAAVSAGLLLSNGHIPIWAALLVCLGVGAAVGTVNAVLIVRLKAIPFVVTLGMMIAVRGLGLYITRSIPVNFPDTITMMAAMKVLGIVPLPVAVFAAAVITAHLFLKMTSFGRQLYAVGNDHAAAVNAGVRTGPVLSSAYIVCGICAGLGGFISVAQLGIVTAGFGKGDEFDAIASAVLGGASLFGGIGTVFPGTVLGTIMIQMVQAGLVFTAMDLYVQPLVMAGIIFFTVYIDSVRTGQLKRLQRRHIMKRE